ncbi:MAG: glutamate racemase [Candidatus Woesebacteria bacterium]|nr:glutamate racemase [Candidatus Woesebacteria bacterium]
MESIVIRNHFVIGIFDSGLGGLTVVKEVKKLLSNSSIVYLGDTARVPYGTRSPETIRKFAKEDVNFLMNKKVDLIVVACNTVSSLALDIVKKHSNVPVFGVVEPAIKKALELTNNNKIGLIGTRATVNSNAYKKSYS